jgi:predicted RNase H-like HicB family nuclease
MDKTRFTVVLEWVPEEEQHVVTIPALAVGSHGATTEETLEKVREAAEVAIEGLMATGHPVPRSDEDKVAYAEVLA